MAEGKSNAGIAEQLVVTEAAVEKHVGRIFAKLGLVPTTTEHRRVLAVLTYMRGSPPIAIRSRGIGGRCCGMPCGREPFVDAGCSAGANRIRRGFR